MRNDIMDMADHDLLITISEDVKHLHKTVDDGNKESEAWLDTFEKDVHERALASEERILVLEDWHASAKTIYAVGVAVMCFVAYFIDGLL